MKKIISTILAALLFIPAFSFTAFADVPAPPPVGYDRGYSVIVGPDGYGDFKSLEILHIGINDLEDRYFIIVDGDDIEIPKEDTENGKLRHKRYNVPESEGENVGGTVYAVADPEASAYCGPDAFYQDFMWGFHFDGGEELTYTRCFKNSKDGKTYAFVHFTDRHCIERSGWLDTEHLTPYEFDYDENDVAISDEIDETTETDSPVTTEAAETTNTVVKDTSMVSPSTDDISESAGNRAGALIVCSAAVALSLAALVGVVVYTKKKDN